MSEAKPGDSDKKCLVCKEGSEGKVLLRGIRDGKDVWVCVHCLPMLIHGSH